MRSEIILTQIDMLKKEHSQALMEKNFQKARQIMNKIEYNTIEYNKIKGEELIQRAIDNGTMARFNLLVSAAQKVREKYLYPLRVTNTTIILVPRKKCNKKYAEEYRKTKMGLNY